MNQKLSPYFLNLGICFVLLIFVCVSCTDKQQTELTNEAIKKSSELQELDNVCKQIPLPQNFKFVRKSGIDDQKITLSYYYYSDTKYLETWNFLQEYFSQNKWQLVKNGEGIVSSQKFIEFTNDTYRVKAWYQRDARSNYSLYCEKLK
jgi:hypothetical protein